MVHYLFLIKDFIQHTEHVFNHIPVVAADVQVELQECCNKILNQFNHLPNISVSIKPTYAEIIYSTETVSKGWIWNSNESTQQVACLVQSIPVLHYTDTSSIACQTDTNCQVNDPSEIIQFNYQEPSIMLDYNPTTYSIPSYNGNGYANTLLFPTWRDQFTVELKQKLAQPNLGLLPTIFETQD